MIRVISRESKLAIIQVEEVFAQLPVPIEYELNLCRSYGDKHQSISLMENIRPDFFTQELDNAVLNHEADVAIHSAKDLPYPLPPGLKVIALTAITDPSDSLVVREGEPYQLDTLPAGAVVGTSSIRRKQELTKYRPDLQIKSVRGTIEERIRQLDQGNFDALIVATCALKRLHLAHRIAHELPFATHPLQGALAVVARTDSQEMEALFSPIDVRSTFGKVTLVGAGPGPRDLLTLAADKALQSADCIFYDDLIDHHYLQSYRAELIPVGKRKGNHSKEQHEINDLLLQYAMEGKNLVRLKGGDPMIFAHGGEEIEHLQSNLIEVEVIPGITTASACSASTQIPLTYRGVSSSVAFVSGHNLSGISIPRADTIVLYMAGTKIKEIARKMIHDGYRPDLPVMLVYHVSFPDQQIFHHTLSDLSENDHVFPTPVIILIGEVVSLHHLPGEYISRSRNVLVTGLDATPYVSLGNIIHTPLIEIKPTDPSEMEATIDQLPDYQYLLFTSKYAVRSFLGEMQKKKKDGRDLCRLCVVSIGEGTTAELNRHFITPDLQATEESSSGILDLFEKHNRPGSVLIPRSNLALPIIPEGLRRLGYQVTTVTAYTNTLPNDAQKVDLSTIGTIVFTSPSCVDNFLQIYGTIPAATTFLAKGSTTYQHLVNNHFPINHIKIHNEKI